MVKDQITTKEIRKMCKKLTVAYGDFIGQRLVGWCVFNGKDYGFLSDKAIKTRLGSGDVVNGLTLDAEGNVSIDKEFTPMLMGKSGLAFSPISREDEGDDANVMNKYYALVKVIKDKSGTRYGFITNRCGYEEFAEGQLKAMLAVLTMGGVQLDGKGRVVVHKAVETEVITGTPEGDKGVG